MLGNTDRIPCMIQGWQRNAFGWAWMREKGFQRTRFCFLCPFRTGSVRSTGNRPTEW